MRKYPEGIYHDVKDDLFLSIGLGKGGLLLRSPWGKYLDFSARRLYTTAEPVINRGNLVFAIPKEFL